MKTILVPLDRYTALVKRATASARDSEADPERLSEDLILLSIPKTFRAKATALLAHLRDKLQWNARGELVLAGKVVLTSNITDLLKDLYRREYAGAPPYAADVFWTILREANAPLSLILNENRKRYLQTLTPVTDYDSEERNPPQNAVELPPQTPSLSEPSTPPPTATRTPAMIHPHETASMSHPRTPTMLTRVRKPPRWTPY